MALLLDDLRLGQEFSCGDFTLTAPEIVEFATRFDPQPWHLEDALAQKTYFRSLCASGLHSQAAAIGLVVRAIGDVAVIAGGALHEARFFVPVWPDLRYAVTACWMSARASVSNPARGVATIRIVARSAGGDPVMECGVTYIVAR